MMQAISAQFDSYSRVARLYPTLLSIAPILWTIVTLHPELLVSSAIRFIVATIALVGGLTLFANIARSRGKRVEEQLLKLWGGWRTSIILRHRDTMIDPYTKARYHEQLRALCNGLSLPTPQEELERPEEADLRYRSATKRLIEVRRDPKYRLLHQENAYYGFRRNLLGLKAFAITAAILMTAVVAVLWFYGQSWQDFSMDTLAADFAVRWPIYVVLLGNVGYLMLWIVVVTPDFALQSANEYANALFRTLD